jgi:hypothetical protein
MIDMVRISICYRIFLFLLLSILLGNVKAILADDITEHGNECIRNAVNSQIIDYVRLDEKENQFDEISSKRIEIILARRRLAENLCQMEIKCIEKLEQSNQHESHNGVLFENCLKEEEKSHPSASKQSDD